VREKDCRCVAMLKHSVEGKLNTNMFIHYLHLYIDLIVFCRCLYGLSVELLYHTKDLVHSLCI
jgi:hypothetical protein